MAQNDAMSTDMSGSQFAALYSMYIDWVCCTLCLLFNWQSNHILLIICWPSYVFSVSSIGSINWNLLAFTFKVAIVQGVLQPLNGCNVYMVAKEWLSQGFFLAH